MDRILDYLIIVIYLISITHIGILSEDRQKSIKNHLLGARSILWWFVLFSIVDAESGNWTFISIPGFAYLSNLNFLQFAFETIVRRIIIAGLLTAAITTIPGSISLLSSASMFRISKKFNGIIPRSTLFITQLSTVVWGGLLMLFAFIFMCSSNAGMNVTLGMSSFICCELLGMLLLDIVISKPSQTDAPAGFI